MELAQLMLNIKYCPFCGSKNNKYHVVIDIEHISNDNAAPRNTYRLKCKNCGARGPIHDDLDVAMNLWETRHEKDDRNLPQGAINDISRFIKNRQ